MFELLMREAAILDTGGQEKINALLKKLKRFTHCPVNLKQAERIKSFSDDVAVLFISRVLPKMSFPDYLKGDSAFDVIAYFYCLALISFSDRKEVVQTLEKITDKMIAEEYAKIDLMKRNLDFFPNRKDFGELSRKINNYQASLMSRNTGS